MPTDRNGFELAVDRNGFELAESAPKRKSVAATKAERVPSDAKLTALDFAEGVTQKLADPTGAVLDFPAHVVNSLGGNVVPLTQIPPIVSEKSIYDVITSPFRSLESTDIKETDSPQEIT